MNSGTSDYQSLINTIDNDVTQDINDLQAEIDAIEVQIIALQVEEGKNYKLDGSKQMDNNYTPTQDYDLITLKFFLEHNIITMSFLRTDGGNSMLADITMESTNEIDINGCRSISNQNTESKVNYQTFDYRTILQNGYYTGNTVNDWVGNNSIVISHKDGKITINEATIDFSNNQLVNINQINNITSAEIATLTGSDTNTTIQTQINDGMTQLGIVQAEVLNLDTKVTNLENTALIKGYNTFSNPLTFNVTGASNPILIESENETSIKGNVDIGQFNFFNKINGSNIEFTSNGITSFRSTPNSDSSSPIFSVDHTGGIRFLSYRTSFGLAYGYISNECKDFYKTIHNAEIQSITGTKTITVGGDFKQDSKTITFNSTNGGMSFNSTNGAIDFKSTSGHFHVDAVNVNLVSNDQVEIQAVTDILPTAQNNIVLAATTGKVALTSGTNIELNSTVDVALDGQNINSNATVTNNVTGISSVNIASLSGPIIINSSTQNINLVAADQVQVQANEMTISSVINYLPLIIGGFSRDIAAKLAYYYLESSFLNTGPFAFHHTFIFQTPQQFQISQVFLQPTAQINYYDNVVGKNILLGPNIPILYNSLDLTPLVGPVSTISNIKITLSVKLESFATAQIPDGLFFVRFYDINSNIGYESRGFNVGVDRTHAPNPIYWSGTETFMYQVDNTFPFFTIWYQPNTSTTGNNYQMCINLSFKIERF